MSDIRFEGVSKRFDDGVDVIRDLNLHVEKGEFMVLVGPSGCAKSTTLRMIAGLESVSSGDLYIGGRRANKMSSGERNISMVFQSYALFPNMTVRGNLSFGLKIRGVSSVEIRKRVAAVGGMLRLTPLMDRKPKQLSGGQAQRVALGRAMIRQPSAFLFDEPLSNLDSELRVQMRGEISDMQSELGTTTVYVTHDQVEAMTMGDRVAVMSKGKILQTGPPVDLYKNPANMFVAGFLGSPRMNLHKSEAILQGTSITFGSMELLIDNATLGFRPEHLLIHDVAGAELQLGSGVVVRVEDLGHESLVHLTLQANGVGLVARVGGEQHDLVRIGQVLPVSISPNRILLFESESGSRIK